MESMWNREKLQRLIQDGIQEGLNLEYKDGRALDSSGAKNTEISKDASSFANSDGGTLIYGISEYNEDGKRQLPERFSPVDQREFSKERLEHIINSIRPKIQGVVIHPVEIDIEKNETVYVVEIPKGTTAYQALDNKYYKRYNFSAVPMEDYEVRQTMARQSSPVFEISHFAAHFSPEPDRRIFHNRGESKILRFSFKLTCENNSIVWARNIQGAIVGWGLESAPKPTRFLHDLTSIKTPDFSSIGGTNAYHLTMQTVKFPVDTYLSTMAQQHVVTKNFILPVSVSNEKFFQKWCGALFLNPENSMPSIFQIEFDFNVEIYSIADRNGRIEIPNESLGVRKLIDQVPEVSLVITGGY